MFAYIRTSNDIPANRKTRLKLQLILRF